MIVSNFIEPKGNDDTEYKKRLFELLTDYHQKAIQSGEIDITNGADSLMTLTMLMEDNWKEEYHAAANG